MLKIGEQIKIAGDEANALKVAIETYKTACLAFWQASDNLRRANEELFRIAQEAYPELKDYDFAVEHEEMVITVTCKKKGKLTLLPPTDTLRLP